MKLELIEVVRVELTLVEAMRTSRDLVHERPALVIRVLAGDIEGFGECSALVSPSYTEEYLDGAERVLCDELIWRLFAAHGECASVEEGLSRMSGVRGNPMAKAALEMALLDVALQEQQVSLAEYLGATTDVVAAGATVGIGSPEDVVKSVGRAVGAGYRRVKVKIAPGADVEVLKAVRDAYPEIVLCADANGAYELDDETHRRVLLGLEQIDLAALEQPFSPDALLDSARLCRMLDTPVVLDESIAGLADLERAIDCGAADAISIKPARLGGLVAARKVAVRATEAGLSCCLGGMYETGLGRASALALGATAGFDLPTDLGGSDRYFAEDLTRAHVLIDGNLAVPQVPGIGARPSPGALERFGAKRTTFRPS